MIELPHDRVEGFLVRITKGLLRHFHSAYDYRAAQFAVRQILPTEAEVTDLQQCLVGTSYEERGDGVIRFRHGITDSGRGGLWLYIFYDAVWYFVVHTIPEEVPETK